MAVSLPVMVVIATTGDRRMKSMASACQPKTLEPNNGPSTASSNIPAKAASRVQPRTTFTKWLVRSVSPLSYSSDIWRTALKDMPRLVAWLKKLTMVVKSDAKPIPAGPSNSATNLLRTNVMAMFSP